MPRDLGVVSAHDIQTTRVIYPKIHHLQNTFFICLRVYNTQGVAFILQTLIIRPALCTDRGKDSLTTPPISLSLIIISISISSNCTKGCNNRYVHAGWWAKKQRFLACDTYISRRDSPSSIPPDLDTIDCHRSPPGPTLKVPDTLFSLNW